MVALLKKIRRLKKAVDKVCSRKVFRKVHPIFTKIQEGIYWRQMACRAMPLRAELDELEQIIEDLPLDKVSVPASYLCAVMRESLELYPVQRDMSLTTVAKTAEEEFLAYLSDEENSKQSPINCDCNDDDEFCPDTYLGF